MKIFDTRYLVLVGLVCFERAFVRIVGESRICSSAGEGGEG